MPSLGAANMGLPADPPINTGRDRRLSSNKISWPGKSAAPTSRSTRHRKRLAARHRERRSARLWEGSALQGSSTPSRRNGFEGCHAAGVRYHRAYCVSYDYMPSHSPRVWGLRHMPDTGLARRCQWWLIFSVFHSLTMIMITVKEFLIFLKDQNRSDSAEMNLLRLASLFVRFLGPFFILLVGIILLARLVRYYPITQDALMTRFIIGSGCIGYLSILLTDMICYKSSTTILELLLIHLTISMHVLRFASQGPLVQLEAVPVIFSLIGIVPGVLCLIPLGEKLVVHLVHHLAFKIATVAAAMFRLIDATVICFHTTREVANNLRSRLQECFQ